MGPSEAAYEEIKARVEADGVEFIYAMFVEMHGQAVRQARTG